MKPIIERISDKVYDVNESILIGCAPVGRDVSQGDGFDHYMVTARDQKGRYITWRAIDRRENGRSELVLDGGRYDFDSIKDALCDMYDRASTALESAHWEYIPKEEF